MLPDRVSNPGPLTYESGALPIALRGPVSHFVELAVNYMQSVTLIRCLVLWSNLAFALFAYIIFAGHQELIG